MVLRDKKILVSPLNWGLGHASRCIPLITRLRSQGNVVAVASDGLALDLLRLTFPDVEYFEMPPYDVHYRYRSMEANLLIQAPKILKTVRQEYDFTQTIVGKWNPDIIISDNRFGVRSSKCKSVFVTHQLTVLGSRDKPSKLATMLHRQLFAKFDECWVPDYKGSKALAGIMSQVELRMPTVHIGPLSRIIRNPSPINIDVLAVLSGPEPQRTILENKLLKVFQALPHLKLYLVRGTRKPMDNSQEDYDFMIFDFADAKLLNKLLNSTQMVVCRSGYSSVMDLDAVQKPAILIPTPGQYEQEYLADNLNEKELFASVEQSNVSQSLVPMIDSMVSSVLAKAHV